MADNRQTKIDVAIRDTKLKLENVNMQLMLLDREKQVLTKQLDALEIIRDNKDFI